ncbi:hypothetical protein GMO_22150 [Gluconobacter morbifer G707]|uniref:Divergent polysaccharide deacetylase family protein n=2 Tax=Gluconobacter TaxID=441 RepID=G6XLG6_9PROT|nr:hypothetical protein GMO_22150 [Gluconobacter morbifer G707]
MFWGLVLAGSAAATAFFLHHDDTPAFALPDVSTRAGKATPATIMTAGKAPSAIAPSLPAPPTDLPPAARMAQTSSPSPDVQPVSQTSFPSPTAPASSEPPHGTEVSIPDVQAVLASGKSALGIVLQGFGYSDALTYEVLARIPSAVGVGVSPYVSNIQDVMARAKTAHHEIYVTLPMQGAHPEHMDEGPHALGYGNTEANDRRELEWCLTRASGATGLTDASENGDDQAGGGYATSPEFQPIADVIANRNLLYLAGSATDDRRTQGMTATAWINGDTDANTLDQQFAAVLPSPGKPARILVMLGPLTPVAIDRLSHWLRGPAAQSFVLLPPSAFADHGNTDGQTADLSARKTQVPL